MLLPVTFSKFQEDFDKAWSQYVKLHKDLDAYRGVDITEKNIKQINDIVSAIQDHFIMMHPSINYIVQRATICSQALTEHQKFMDDLKASGAMPENAPVEQEAQA